MIKPQIYPHLINHCHSSPALQTTENAIHLPSWAFYSPTSITAKSKPVIYPYFSDHIQPPYRNQIHGLTTPGKDGPLCHACIPGVYCTNISTWMATWPLPLPHCMCFAGTRKWRVFIMHLLYWYVEQIRPPGGRTGSQCLKLSYGNIFIITAFQLKRILNDCWKPLCLPSRRYRGIILKKSAAGRPLARRMMYIPKQPGKKLLVSRTAARRPASTGH